MSDECDHDWLWGDGRNAGSAECRKCRTWQQASSIAYDLRVQRDEAQAAVLIEREACAAYCLDRADQYDTNCGIWPALADAAEGIAKGEAAGMLARGDTEDLVARVRTLAGFTRKTHAKPRAM